MPSKRFKLIALLAILTMFIISIVIAFPIIKQNVLVIIGKEVKIKLIDVDRRGENDGIELIKKHSSFDMIYEIESSGWFDFFGDGKQDEFYAIYYVESDKIVKYITIVSKRTDKELLSDVVMSNCTYAVKYFLLRQKPQLLIAATIDNKIEKESKTQISIYESSKEGAFMNVFDFHKDGTGKIEFIDDVIKVNIDGMQYQLIYINKYEMREIL